MHYRHNIFPIYAGVILTNSHAFFYNLLFRERCVNYNLLQKL